MIQINLLPKEYVKKEPEKKTKEPSVKGERQFNLRTWFILGGCGLSVVGVVVFILFLVLPNASLERKLNEISVRKSLMKKDLKLAFEYKDERDLLSKKLEYLEKYQDERVLWAPALNDLSFATPELLQLTRFYFREEKEKPEVKKRKKKKEKKNKVVEKVYRYLIIEGVLPEFKNESLINVFIENLVKTEYFSKLFSKIALVSIVSQEDGIKRFRIQCLVRKEFI